MIVELELEQNADSPSQNFSIKPELNTLPAMQMIDMGSLQSKPTEIISTNSYSVPDTPPDDKPYSPRGYWERPKKVVKSVSWELLYVSNEVIGYKLLLAFQEDSYQPQPFSWIPVVATIVVGWLSTTYWNLEAPMFTQLDQQEIHANHELQIITLPAGGGDSNTTCVTSGVTGSGLTSQKYPSRFYYQSAATWVRDGTNDGEGDEPHEPWHSRCETVRCPTCNGLCELRPRVNPPDDLNSQEQPLLLMTHCRPDPDGSFACSVNAEPQTEGQKSNPHPLNNMHPARFDTVLSAADSTTQTLEKSPPATSGSRNRYKCGHEGCNKQFRSKPGLKGHLRTHTGELFKCDHEGCDKEYQYEKDLKGHLRTHTGELFKCDHEGCDKEYQSEIELKKHQSIIHNGEFVKCDHDGCNRQFQSEKGLKGHQRTHTGELFKCDHEGCDKAYQYKSGLKEHRRTHTGEPSAKRQRTDGEKDNDGKN
ncbi:zinc finger C2H2-type domain-containing protein [Endozoicomonas montiporae CL-33]|uniref:Zinc finger C2H2-type domain-containing protein n=1 Tax=Endozoicomonas montiporae CL-33 TaxID=570277 RepID=A0A142B907_9GAMM|nr:C2H2-type zinc finger protein [Endozoicomonas montiporae]AMO55233.1 zinc finger C2H2-type domain-containing protein [Endozoicomonas montiporae CL-33]